MCSCIGSICTSNNQFDCLDSAAGDELYDCAAPPPPALPCSEEAQQRWLVDDPAEALALAAAVNCSGGSFKVEWWGNVVVLRRWGDRSHNSRSRIRCSDRWKCGDSTLHHRQRLPPPEQPQHQLRYKHRRRGDRRSRVHHAFQRNILPGKQG